MSEKGKQDTGSQQQKSKLKKILHNKINTCIYVIELLRLGCENHFLEMQNFLREQPHSRKPINYILFVVDLFEKYSKIMNESNSPLGEKMLDFLVEAIQGPCLEN